MKILEDKSNDLLKRREVKIIVEESSNPSMDKARKIVAEEFKAAEEGILIKKIKGKFGRKTFLIVANIYKSNEDKKKIEPQTKKELEEEKKENKEEKEEDGEKQ